MSERPTKIVVELTSPSFTNTNPEVIFAGVLALSGMATITENYNLLGTYKIGYTKESLEEMAKFKQAGCLDNLKSFPGATLETYPKVIAALSNLPATKL